MRSALAGDFSLHRRALGRGRGRRDDASRAIHRRRRGVGGIKNEIRTRDAVERAAALLGVSERDAKDARTLKRAFRAAALKTHPDIAGTRSAEAFKATQAAYRTLRAAALETEGEIGAASALEEDDVAWVEHDWKWRSRMHGGDAETSRKKTDEERRAEAFARLEFVKASAEGRVREGEGGPKKRNKRVIKPISQQRVPTKEEIAAMESGATAVPIGKGQASRSSTSGAHDALSSQLDGLHRVSRMRRRESVGVTDEAEKYATHYSTIKAIEDSEEERFLRLAKLAQEWRSKQAKWRETGSTQKMSPRELLQAAVHGASLGACA